MLCHLLIRLNLNGRDMRSQNIKESFSLRRLSPRAIFVAGELMYATHESLKHDYAVSCEEADFIVEEAVKSGVAGARIMGGGFGGCVLCLMDYSVEAAFKEVLVPAYEKVWIDS